MDLADNVGAGWPGRAMLAAVHVVGRTLDQEHPQLPFQALQLLA